MLAGHAVMDRRGGGNIKRRKEEGRVATGRFSSLDAGDRREIGGKRKKKRGGEGR